MQVVHEDEFANVGTPILITGEGVPIMFPVRTYKIVLVDHPGPPSHMFCGGELGCGSYMIPLGRVILREAESLPIPIYVCFLCDKRVDVLLGPEGARIARGIQDGA